MGAITAALNRTQGGGQWRTERRLSSPGGNVRRREWRFPALYLPFLLMILPLALLVACGGERRETAAYLQSVYQEMSGCTMEAKVSCQYQGIPWEAELRCEYVPEGECVIEALSPELIAGVRAVLDGERRSLVFDGETLNAGTVSREALSPAECLPRLMDALREGWILEENEENRGDTPCLRVCLDQSGARAEKIYALLWLRLPDGAPVRGEITVDGETVLTAEFTSFAFCDTLSP